MNTPPVLQTPVSTPGQTALPVSVIVPTCNPRPEVIRKTLDALRAQTLPFDDWELIVVDNNSQPPLHTRLDLSWHPRARFAFEQAPGVMACRSRGLRESCGEVVISVDDDNILAPDYLAVALHLAHERPQLGVWGGQIQPQYESPPPPWLHQFSHHLAIIEIDRPCWSSFVDDRSIPYGASMCIRRAVVEAYLERFDREAENFAGYGRTYTTAKSGIVGMGGEDQLVSYTASMIGYSMGRFPELLMHHQIASSRFDPTYFLRMVRGNARGALRVQLLHGNAPRYRTALIWPFLKCLHALLKYRGFTRRIKWIESIGEMDALLERRRHGMPPPVPASKHPNLWQTPSHRPPTHAVPTVPAAAPSFPSAIQHEQRP